MLHAESETHKKPKQLAPPFARISKNLIVRGGFANLVRRYDLTSRDIQVFVTLLCNAQYQNHRTIRFTSEYELLKLLEWGDGRPSVRDYSDLRSALDKWSRVAITMKRFRCRRKIYIDGGSITSRVVRKQRFPSFLKARTTPSGKISITFGKTFWEYHGDLDEGYFIQARPDHIRKFRRRQTILLYFLLDAFDDQLKLNLPAFTRRTDITLRHVPYVLKRASAALEIISSVKHTTFAQPYLVRRKEKSPLVRIHKMNYEADWGKELEGMTAAWRQK